jgi:hypothetical protein
MRAMLHWWSNEALHERYRETRVLLLALPLVRHIGGFR